MILYVSNSFYIIVILLVVCCFLDILYISLLKPLIYKTKAIKLLKKEGLKNKQVVHILKGKKEKCTFLAKINEEVYHVKVLQSPKNSDIQINNIDTFIAYVKSGDNLKAKNISGMTSFMKSKLNNKIIIVPFKAKTIKKVINECEMIMVNPSVDVYGCNIYNKDQIKELFK